MHAIRERTASYADSTVAPTDDIEWNAPSLCRGWRVRDVAGHLALVPTITTWDMVSVAPRARFNPNRINTQFVESGGSGRGTLLHERTSRVR